MSLDQIKAAQAFMDKRVVTPTNQGVDLAVADSGNVQGHTPRHEHDCSACVFLGRHKDADLYFHESGIPAFTTVIARYGPDGNYFSGLAFSAPYRAADGNHCDPIEDLAEARKRAIDQGHGNAIARATGAAK